MNSAFNHRLFTGSMVSTTVRRHADHDDSKSVHSTDDSGVYDCSSTPLKTIQSNADMKVSERPMGKRRSECLSHSSLDTLPHPSKLRRKAPNSSDDNNSSVAKESRNVSNVKRHIAELHSRMSKYNISKQDWPTTPQDNTSSFNQLFPFPAYSSPLATSHRVTCSTGIPDEGLQLSSDIGLSGPLPSNHIEPSLRQRDRNHSPTLSPPLATSTPRRATELSGRYQKMHNDPEIDLTSSNTTGYYRQWSMMNYSFADSMVPSQLAISAQGSPTPAYTATDIDYNLLPNDGTSESYPHTASSPLVESTSNFQNQNRTDPAVLQTTDTNFQHPIHDGQWNRLF